MRKLGPGIYLHDEQAADGGQLQIDIPEILDHMGLEHSEANKDMVEEMMPRALKEVGMMSETAVDQRTHREVN